jgi:hypothetical protein
MTLFDVEELCGYWAEYPPAHLGMPRRRPPRPHKDGVEAVLAELGPGIAAGDVGAGLPPAIFDFARLKAAGNAPADRG